MHVILICFFEIYNDMVLFINKHVITRYWGLKEVFWCINDLLKTFNPMVKLKTFMIITVLLTVSVFVFIILKIYV